ncbi:aspartate aminotransferase family protein [Subtercola sp. YIM 133946]|uniref:aspartate aminotransferase family protein n=1 Tax=Subtercola sp. YIM 133946 TaxID=3118909 RepID=UPI002F93F207
MSTNMISTTTETLRVESLLARRAKTIGRYSPTFYDLPLEIVAGDGVWLTAADGTRYLDAYNNVPCVGHANREVREAISAQLELVNLHTRYLNDRVVEYAERLLDTFRGRLQRIFFTNSGSESNELALRIANQHTGATGLIVTDWSYHGNTTSLAVATTALEFREPLGDHVRPVHVPDATGAEPADVKRLLSAGLAEVDAAISSLIAAGHGVSAALFDPLFSTEGLVQPPAGYVEGLCERVHAAGGLVIADEVQSGFGRVGAVMWGHEMFDIGPDLVTLGKPMGNGHPLGAVITTTALLDEFGSRNMYFNTFAGSPVSSVAGLAVLDVIRDKKLVESAHNLGLVISERLQQISLSPHIGSVRGRGLYFGVDFVTPDNRADTATAKAVVEDMKSRGVLISRIGREGNVLKMRPPMVITRDEVDLLLDTLASSVSAIDDSDN